MAQEIVAKLNGKVSKLSMPSPQEKVMSGVYWGDCTFVFTPAYWKTLAWMDEAADASSYRLGETLTEEITACLLGGYGIPAEVGLAAFYQIKDCGVLESDCPPTAGKIYEVLSMPLNLRNKRVRYRFAKQKAQYISSALKKLSESDAPAADHRALRQWLLEFDGIGYKTASWITRNWLQSDEVAIIDVHIHRAGNLIGLYSAVDSPSRNYLSMEDRFLNFAQEINVKASQLDALIWRQMKDAGNMALRHLENVVKA